MDDTFLSTVGLEADVPSSRMASDMAQIYPETFVAQCQSRSVIANGPPLANAAFRRGGTEAGRGTAVLVAPCLGLSDGTEGLTPNTRRSDGRA